MTQENEIEDQNEPAYPDDRFNDGWSKLEDACIRLKVPKSGKPWLDDLIREAKRDEFAGLAMQGFCSNPSEELCSAGPGKIAAWSYLWANAMLDQKGEEK